MKNIKKALFGVLLALIYRRRIYSYPFVQSCPKLQLIISLGDNFILVKDSDSIKLPSVEINVGNKHSILLTVKNFLNSSVSKKISNSSFLDLKLVDFYREMKKTDSESSLFIDNLYIKLNIENYCIDQDLLKNAVLSSINDIKLLQFKNQINTLDYKIILKSQKEEGISIK